MKLVLITAISLITIGEKRCGHAKTVSSKSTTCFKGRLEIKGACSNYTISLLEGAMDTSQLVASWKNSFTGKVYTNVFALKSTCSFPATINEGDEFYFELGDKPQNCMRCMIYYPTPPKAASIKVLDKPCQ